MKSFNKKTALLFSLSFLVFSEPQSPAESPTRGMAETAKNFLNSLTLVQKEKANFELKDQDRLNWHFIPKTRPGLPLKEMSDEQSLPMHSSPPG